VQWEYRKRPCSTSITGERMTSIFLCNAGEHGLGAGRDRTEQCRLSETSGSPNPEREELDEQRNHAAGMFTVAGAGLPPGNHT
jgi:hypothetical protein